MRKFLPKYHTELEHFINEYVNFPHGKHDDMLDSMELTLKLVNRPYFDMDPI